MEKDCYFVNIIGLKKRIERGMIWKIIFVNAWEVYNRER